MADDYSDIHDAIGIKPTDELGPLPAAKFLGQGVGELTGVNDLVRAIQSGKPENILYAGGMLGLGAALPGGKVEKAAMTMGKLFPEATWLGESKLLSPTEYVDKLGGAKGFAENFPASWEKIKPHYYAGNEDLDDTKLQDYLKKNPGGSIMDYAGAKPAWGPTSEWQQKAQAATAYAKANALRSSDFPRELPFDIPPKAQAQDYNVKAVHGTPDRWEWEGPLDQLKLPEEQLGVHFGNPRQAAHFSMMPNVPEYLASTESYRSATPRTYPAVIRAQSPLELRDMGSWGLDEMREALGEINAGTHTSYVGGKRIVSDWAKGQFPQGEVDKLRNIQEVRDYLTKKGYDSIKYTNSVEDPGHTSYILFQGSPVQKGYVTGARSPFAAFDPSKTHWASLAAGMGGILAYPLAKGEDK